MLAARHAVRAAAALRVQCVLSPAVRAHVGGSWQWRHDTTANVVRCVVTAAGSPQPAPRESDPDKSTATPSTSSSSDLRRLFQLYRPEKRRLTVAFGALSLSTGITMLVPAGIGRVIDSIATTQENLPSVVITLASVFLVGAAANMARVALMNTVGESITARLRRDMYQALLRQDMSFFDAVRTGELVSRLASDTTVIGKTLSDNVSSGLRSAAQAVGAVTAMYLISPKLTAAMLALVPPLALGAVWYGRYVKGLSREVQDLLGASNELAEERLSNIRTVRYFGQEDSEVELFSKRVFEVLDRAVKQGVASGVFYGTVDLGVKMSMLAVLWYGGSMVLQSSLTVGELTSFLLYTVYVGFSTAGLSAFYSDVMKGVGASRRVFELVDRKPSATATVTDALTSHPHTSAQPSEAAPETVLDPASSAATVAAMAAAAAATTALPRVVGRVEFTGVRFAYPTRAQVQVFKGVDFAINPGETLGLVGGSGSGKSTAASLLARLYELQPGDGTISLDGVNIASVSPAWLRSQIGVVSQEPVLFAGTIADNIRYGMPDASREDIRQAAKLANAHGFIKALPDGYDTHVGERGQTLSGGQKQRVAIARALLRNPRVLILDEATSALDPESETLVQEALGRLRVGRTVLLISHRYTTLRMADRLAVLSGGQVVETGTWEELSSDPTSHFSQVMRSL